MWKERLELQIGKDNVDALAKLTVLIVGLGGVGSSAALSLARLGIEKFVIVDYDVVTVSNINRQLIANTKTIGRPKVDVTKEMILDINPNCEVITYNKKMIYNTKLLFEHNIDYVVDACDTVTTKLELIKYTTRNNIKLISSMGAGNKLDPSKLEITELKKTSYDPLARVLRKLLRENQIDAKIPVVSSREKPLDSGDVISSNSVIPPMAGLLITSYILNDVINHE